MIADYQTPETLIADRRRKRRWRPWWVYVLVVSIVLLIVSILMPALHQTSPYHGNRGKCMSQLRSIGLAIQLYANENRGQMPPDLATIAETQDVVGEMFVCPSTNDYDDKRLAPDEVRAAEAAGKLSYIYIGSGLLKSLTRDDVVVYESAGNHGSNEYNVLFGDGHVESLDAATTQPIAQQRAAGVSPVKLAKNRTIVLGSR